MEKNLQTNLSTIDSFISVSLPFYPLPCGVYPKTENKLNFYNYRKYDRILEVEIAYFEKLYILSVAV